MTQSTERLPSLTEARLEELNREIRRVLGGSCYFRNLEGGASGALLHRDIMDVLFKVFAAAPSLLSSLREARALVKEAQPYLQKLARLASAGDAIHDLLDRIWSFLGDPK